MAIDPQLVLQYNVQKSVFLEVLGMMDDFENGSENVNLKHDFLGADQLPPLHETAELEDM